METFLHSWDILTRGGHIRRLVLHNDTSDYDESLIQV